MVRLFFNLLFDYFKDAFKNRATDTWPGILFGYFTGVHIVFGSAFIEVGLIPFLFKLGGVAITVAVSTMTLALTKDVHKLFVQPYVKKLLKKNNNDNSRAA